MISDAEKARLEALEQRIAAAKAAQVPKRNPKAEAHDQAQLAWRMVIELVAGLMIGFGIGYSLDLVFGTAPIFLVLFILAGFAAGVKTMLSSARQVQAKAMAKAEKTNAAPVVADEKED